MQKIDKILIIQTAFLGDVILTTPLAYHLKKIYPNSSLDFLTIPNSKNILENNPDIKEIIIFDKRGEDKGISGLLKLGKKLHTRHYDLCITPHRSMRSAYLTYATGAAIRIGFDRNAMKYAFTDIVKYRPDLHEVERNLKLISAFQNGIKITRPFIYPTAEDKNFVDLMLKDKNINQKSRIFALAPGSVWPTKRWPEAYYEKFSVMLAGDNYIPVFVGGPEDRTLCTGLEKKCPQAISLSGSLSLRQTAYFLSKCAGLITNDSAPLHLGLAAQIPVYAIFGATIPEFGFAPFGASDKILEVPHLACRPCGIHGGKKCPTKTFDCMLKLNPEQVYRQIMK